MSRNLKKESWHSTSQRKLVLDVLQEAGKHVDAKEIYLRASAKDPGISMATVYRSLNLFKNAGIVDERHIGELHCFYEIKREGEHQHLICKGCGQIIDIESPLLKKLLSDIQHKSNFRITKAELYLEGYCDKCRDRKE